MSNVIPFVRGSDTSKAAAEAKEPTAASDRARVYSFIFHASTGATDDEIEASLGMRHQNASARRRGLVLDGMVCDSGLRRLTRSGRKATVWQVGTDHGAVRNMPSVTCPTCGRRAKK